MSKAAKKKVRTEMTAVQVARKLAKDVKEMSAEEKAKVREHLSGLAEAARRCAAEEAAMLNYDGKGKPVN
jgi:hypothetical protein